MEVKATPNAKVGDRINQKEAKEWLIKTLGPFIPVEFTPVLIRLSNMDGFSYGRFHDAMITLSLKGPAGLEYHEGYHAVEEMFLTDQEIKSLLEESRERYPAPSQNEIEKFQKKYPGISKETAERIYFLKYVLKITGCMRQQIELRV